MSQNDTPLKLVRAFATVALLSLGAVANAGTMKDCIMGQLRTMGVDPRMQNIYNPRTYAGKLAIKAAEMCQKTSQLKDREELNGKDKLVLPASTTEVQAPEAVREI